MNRPIYKLRDWIDPKKLNWFYTTFLTNSIDFLRDNPQYIDWTSLCYNSNAIELIEKNLDKVNWIHYVQIMKMLYHY